MPTELVANSPTPGVSAPLGTLSGALTSGSMTMSGVTAPSALRAVSGQFRVLIDSEIIVVASSASGASPWTILQRGAEGTTATSHGIGASVFHFLTAGGLTALTAPSAAATGFSVMNYGAIGDGVADDTAAFVAVLAAVEAKPNNLGARIKVPAGIYNVPTWPALGLTWSDRCIIWEGDGAGTLAIGGATRIKFPAGVVGFNPKNGASGYGSRSAFRDLHLVGSDISAGSNQGILMQCNEGQIDDCVVEKFGGPNVHVLSGASVADPTINANCCRIRGLRVTGGKSDGLKLEGVDSNACLIDGIDATDNAGWGVYNAAYLVNTFIAPQFATNIAGDFRIGAGVGYTRVFGGYWEDNNSIAIQFDAGSYGCVIDGATLGNYPTGNATRINDLTAGSGGHNVLQVIGGYALQSELNIGNNQLIRVISLQAAQKRIALLKGSALLFEDPGASQWWTDAVIAGGDRVVQNLNGGQFGSFSLVNALKLAGGARFYSGAGVPGAISGPNNSNPLTSDFYVRTDGNGAAKANLYLCTVGGASPTWVGLA